MRRFLEFAIIGANNPLFAAILYRYDDLPVLCWMASSFECHRRAQARAATTTFVSANSALGRGFGNSNV